MVHPLSEIKLRGARQMFNFDPLDVLHQLMVVFLIGTGGSLALALYLWGHRS